MGWVTARLPADPALPPDSESRLPWKSPGGLLTPKGPPGLWRRTALSSQRRRAPTWPPGYVRRAIASSSVFFFIVTRAAADACDAETTKEVGMATTTAYGGARARPMAGWIVFAATMMMVIGSIDFFEGLIAV